MVTAPPVYPLAARDAALDLPLDGEHVYAATDGCGVEVADLETGRAAPVPPLRRRRDRPPRGRPRRGCLPLDSRLRPGSAGSVALAARAPRLLGEHHEARPDRIDRHRARGPRRGGDGRRHRRRPRGPSGAPGPLDDAVHHQPARPRRREHRCRPGRRRGGGPGRLHDDGLGGLHRPGHRGRLARCRQRRGGRRARPHADRLPRLPGLLRGRADRDGPPLRRLHRRRPGGLPLRRRHQPAGRLLPRAPLDGGLRHRRQGARLAGRRRELALVLPGGGVRVGHAAGPRAHQREPDLLPRAAPPRRGDLLDRAGHAEGDPGHGRGPRARGDRRGRAGGRLPDLAAHPAPHARDVEVALHGPAPDGRRGGRGRRAAGLGEREGARAPRDPRPRAARAGPRPRDGGAW